MTCYYQLRTNNMKDAKKVFIGGLVVGGALGFVLGVWAFSLYIIINL